ncbi:MAG: hypothetical protein V4650_06220 [Pseudomonadota bacterium]
MKKIIVPLLTLLLSACATKPIPETPIEEAQRRMPAEPPVVVADGCLYRRNLAYLNHFIIDESRDLGQQGAKEVMAGFKEFGVDIKQFVVPVMCATKMPPRGDEKGGRISQSESTQDKAESLTFPEPLSPLIANDAALFAAYGQIFDDCDDKRRRKEKRYDCPLLKPEQAALLKSRLKTSYIVAVSVGGERVSTASRSAGALFGVFLGFINIAGDAGVARVRLVNLDTGALVYSSFTGDYNGQSPADLDSNGGGGSRGMQIDERWVKRMVKPLFEKQR